MTPKKCSLLLVSFLVSPSVLIEVPRFDICLLVLQQILPLYRVASFSAMLGAFVARDDLPLRTLEGHWEPVRTVYEA